MATIDIYRVNDPDVLTGAYRARLEQLTARMEIEQSILRPALSLSHKVLRDAAEQIRLNKAMTAPCRRLPREVLAEIFLFVSSAPRYRLHQWDFKHRYEFAKVCLMWRSVALGTACLWSDICVCSQKSTATLERELRRTKQHLLDVDLYRVDIEIPSNQKAWELLRRESHRWRTLSRSEACTIGCLPEPVSCPALETAKAELILPDMPRTADYRRPSGEILVFSHVRHALNLRRVDVTVMYDHDLMRIRFPDCWQLTHLTLTLLCGEHVIYLLRRVMEQVSPTLEVLIISIDEGMEISRPTSPFAYPFSKLRTLELHQEAFGFITLIEAPVLAFLRVKDSNLGEIEDSDGFPTLSEALGKVARLKTLAKLELICVDVEDASALLATLWELPNIEWLRLADIPRHIGCLLSYDTLAGLTRGGTSVDGVDTPRNALCPLPNLSTLFVHFIGCDAEDVDVEVATSLRSLALSRHPSVANQEDGEGSSLRSLHAFRATYGMDEEFAKDVIPSWGLGESFSEADGWNSD